MPQKCSQDSLQQFNTQKKKTSKTTRESVEDEPSLTETSRWFSTDADDTMFYRSKAHWRSWKPPTNVGCQVHIVCLLVDFHIRRWREMLKVLSQNSRPQFESVGTSPAFLWPPKLSVPHGKSNHLVFNKPTRLQNCRLRFESLETFPDVLVATKTGKFSREGQTISSRYHSNQNRYFQPNHEVFPTLTRWFLCLNLIRA